MRNIEALITGALRLDEAQCQKLASLGFPITVQPDEMSITEQPEKFEVVICNGLFLHNQIDRFEGLRYIQLTSAGYDRVPLDEINRRGIRVRNAHGIYSKPMAEFALCGVLQLYKQTRFFF